MTKTEPAKCQRCGGKPVIDEFSQPGGTALAVYRVRCMSCGRSTKAHRSSDHIRSWGMARCAAVSEWNKVER